MNTIAVLSDIHGNLEALQAVLKDINAQGITEIYCLGDTVAKGYHQQECIDLVRKAVSVNLQGNCEYFFTNEQDLSGKAEIHVQRYLWNKKRITEETRKYLRELPFCHEIMLSGRLVRFLHATPSVINGFTANIDSLDRTFSMFEPGPYTLSDQIADVVVYGHIHTPFAQKIYNRILLNTGSVGNALDIIRDPQKDGDLSNTTVASYLILRGEKDSFDRNQRFSYEIVNVPYDISKELKDLSMNLEPESYKEELVEGRYRDMERLQKLYAQRKAEEKTS